MKVNMKKSNFKFLVIAFLLLVVLLFNNCATTAKKAQLRIGFDIDDTLLFSTPAFEYAKQKFAWDTTEFWRCVNSADSEYSIIKKKTYNIIKTYQKQGAEIFVITARPAENTEPLKEFISVTFNIPKQNIFFEPKSKVERIKFLNLHFFFGDSDNDILDAQVADVIPIRIKRSSKSSYKDNNGVFIKYNPGKFDEQVIENSED